MGSRKRVSLAKSAAMMTAVGVVSQFLSFVYRAVLTRMIGAELLGVQQLVLHVYAVMQSAALTGLTAGVSCLTAGYHARGNQRGASALLRLALFTFVGLWLPIAGAVALYSDEISMVILNDERTRLGLLLLIPMLLLTGIENLNKHHFYGLGETGIPAATELTEQLIRTAAILGLLSLFLPLDGAHTVMLIFLGMLVSEVFSSLALTLIRRRKEGRISGQKGQKEPLSQMERQLLKVAIPVSATAILDNLMDAANAILIPRGLAAWGCSAAESMELYGVVYGMTLPMLMLPFAFVRALSLTILPHITGFAATGRIKELNRSTAQAVFYTAAILFPVTALLVTIGDDLGLLLFGDERTALFLLPLSAVTCVSGLQAVLAAVLNGIGKQGESAAVSLVCGFVQLSFTVAGTARFGMAACVAGMLSAGALGFVCRLRLVRRTTGFSPELFRCLWAPGLAAVLSGLCSHLLYRVLLDGGYSLGVSMGMCGVFCGGMYLLTLGVELRCEVRN